MKNRDFEAIRPSCVLAIDAGEKRLYAHIEANPSGDALKQMLSSQTLSVEMRASGGCDMTGFLPWDLPQSGGTVEAQPGDLLLSEGKRIDICFSECRRTATRLARVGNATRERLTDVLGEGGVLKFWLEWGE